jgi:hypothetical protein
VVWLFIMKHAKYSRGCYKVNNGTRKVGFLLGRLFLFGFVLAGSPAGPGRGFLVCLLNDFFGFLELLKLFELLLFLFFLELLLDPQLLLL